jgi:hypothetical protein
VAAARRRDEAKCGYIAMEQRNVFPLVLMGRGKDGTGYYTYDFKKRFILKQLEDILFINRYDVDVEHVVTDIDIKYDDVDDKRIVYKYRKTINSLEPKERFEFIQSIRKMLGLKTKKWNGKKSYELYCLKDNFIFIMHLSGKVSMYNARNNFEELSDDFYTLCVLLQDILPQ